MLPAAAPLFLIAAGLAAFAAGFVKGFAGFGFALVFTPLISLLSDDPRQVVFVALVLGALMSLFVIADIRHAIAPAIALRHLFLGQWSARRSGYCCSDLSTVQT